jgi:hypothetical protein
MNGNVGVGTISPQSYYSGADNLVVAQASGEGGISIVTANNTTGALYFADGTTGDEQYRGGIAYVHTTDILTLVSGGSNKFALFADGNLQLTSGTISNAGYKLDVNGTGRFLSGSSSTIGLIVGGAGGAGSTRQGQLRFGDAGSVYKIQGGEDYSAFNFMIGSGTPFSIASNGAATFSSSVTANGTLVVGIDNVAGNKYVSLTPSATSTPLNIQGVQAGVGPYALSIQASGGNVLIGTATDNGSRFQVNGASSFAGTAIINSGTRNVLFLVGTVADNN